MLFHGWVVITHNTCYVAKRSLLRPGRAGIPSRRTRHNTAMLVFMQNANVLEQDVFYLVGVSHSPMWNTSFSGAVPESCAHGQAAGFPLMYNSAAQREHGGHSTTSPPGLRSQMYTMRESICCVSPTWTTLARPARIMFHRASACGKF